MSLKSNQSNELNDKKQSRPDHPGDTEQEMIENYTPQ